MNQAMDERHARIQAQHLERTAYVYVRQSSARQVIEHLESQRRQYDLVNWASTAGWPVEQVVVTDEDQGKSGSTAKTRERLAGTQTPEGWVGVTEAARRLGVSKSLVAYWVKSGKLAAVRVTVGKRRCWKIDPVVIEKILTHLKEEIPAAKPMRLPESPAPPHHQK